MYTHTHAQPHTPTIPNNSSDTYPKLVLTLNYFLGLKMELNIDILRM